MLAAIVLIAQVATAPPNPCQDEMSRLCRISPFFCPGAYPPGLEPGTNGVPCWPQGSRVPVAVQGRVPRNVERGESAKTHAAAQTRDEARGQVDSSTPRSNLAPSPQLETRHVSRGWWARAANLILP
jgi:hypothetical protein